MSKVESVGFEMEAMAEAKVVSFKAVFSPHKALVSVPLRPRTKRVGSVPLTAKNKRTGKEFLAYCCMANAEIMTGPCF